MKPKSLFALGWAWLLAAGTLCAADGPHSQTKLKVSFGGSESEVVLESGESARIRNQKTGEALFLRVLPEPAAPGKARIEISRAQGAKAAQQSEIVELEVGEIARTRRFSSTAELELLDIPSTGVTKAARPDRFQVTFMLPGDRKVMAVGEARPEEVVLVRDRDSGLSVGLRPSFPKAGRPIEVEVFSADQKSGRPGRLIARVPVGGEFTLRGNAEENSVPVKIRGRIELPDPAMWDGEARVESIHGPVRLKAHWADGPWMEGLVQDGNLFRIAIPSAGSEVAFAPASTCSDDGSVALSVFEIRRIPGAGESLKFIETIQAQADQPTRLRSFGGLVEVQTVARRGGQEKGTCWLNCGDSSAHGCDVACGGIDCCIGRCCFPIF